MYENWIKYRFDGSHDDHHFGNSFGGWWDECVCTCVLGTLIKSSKYAYVFVDMHQSFAYI